MKKISNKLICVMMSLILIFPMAVKCFCTQKKKCTPIVYVIGKVDVIKQDKDNPDSKTLYPISLEGDVSGGATTITKAFLAAYNADLSGKDSDELWNEYGTILYKEVSDLYAELKLNEDGEPSDNSGILWNWKDNEGKSTLIDTVSQDGTYGLEDYMFHYDWRLDMFYNAEILNEYINDVLKATNSEKCVLISRCYGCNLVAAYLSEYGNDKISDCILYCSTAAGSVVTGEMFSGNFALSSQGMQNYIDDLFGVNPFSADISKNVLKKSGNIFDSLAETVNEIYDKISNVMMPKTLINSFASMPGYWSMISDDNNYYEDALQFIFGDPESEDRLLYQNLIQKIDGYHYTVTNNCTDFSSDNNLFKKISRNGTRVELVVKYGNQIAPMIKSCDMLGDGIVQVETASLGATACKVDERFENDYLDKSIRKGTIDYIDENYQIDASTAMFPETTWFTENIDHFDFPKSVDALLLAISRSNGTMTVFSNSEFPQFREYKGEGNLATWAGGLYINNSTDETAVYLRAIINKLSEFFSTILNFFTFLRIT